MISIISARFVNLLREVLVGKLADAAAEIEDSGHSHPSDGIDEELLEAFDTYRALLEQVGCVRTVPAAQVEVDLSEYRGALVTALRERLEFERYMMNVDRESPEGAKQHRRAQRNLRQIEAFIAGAGLEGNENAAPQGGGA